MRSLYIECNSGISGDMTVGALLDLGADEKVLMDVLSTIEPKEFEIKISRVKKSGLDCLDFDVVLEHDNHDHDMNYLYGETHDHLASHHHLAPPLQGELSQKSIETHLAPPLQGELSPKVTEGVHHHRSLADINKILDSAQMTTGARKICDNIFNILAEAESKAHGVPVSEVHFHEVGAVDSIVDIVSIAVCLDNLGLDEVFVTKLYDGTGTVRCQHGVLPVPVPAVLNIISAHSIPLEILDTKGELVTPTGAAFVAAVRTKSQLPKEFTIEKIGYGAGKRDTGLAGFVRAMIIKN